MPEIGVVNSGDEPREYEFPSRRSPQRVRSGQSRTGFNFEPERFPLNPGETRKVSIRLVLPTGAEPGDYAAHLEAHPVATSGQSVGIAVATELTFTIEPSSWLDAQRRRIDRWLNANAPWTYLVPAALLLGFIAFRMGRLPFRLRLERK